MLLQPEWVTAKTMNATVVADKFVPVTGSGSLCAGSYKMDCTKYGIK